MEKYSLVLGIPTIHSDKYIYQSLSRYKKEVLLLPKHIKTTIIICINGTRDDGATRNAIDRFINENRDLNVKLLEIERGGKNIALNAILEYAREGNYDILHYFDDDVQFEPGSLKCNIHTLIQEEERLQIPVMVGSNFVGISRDWAYFKQKYGSVFKATKVWILHNILITPFKMDCDRPRFCIGQSLGAFVKNIKDYPDDSTGILDDGFIGNCFALEGKSHFEEYGESNIFKPKESIVYFNIPTSYREWYRQSLRNYVGIYYSYCYHENQMDFFEKYFAWEYSFGKKLRRKGKYLGVKHAMGRFIYRIMQRHVLKEGKSMIEYRKIPAWATAHSTKLEA